MKVEQLEGAQLAFWVAKAMGERPIISPVDGCCYIGWDMDRVPCQSSPGKKFAPHEDWAQGGPLIDKYDGNIVRQWVDRLHNTKHACSADMGTDVKRYRCFGPTRLIAACRALVGHVFGAEVPDDASHA